MEARANPEGFTFKYTCFVSSIYLLVIGPGGVAMMSSKPSAQTQLVLNAMGEAR
jgi:hypothetical protein